MSPGYYHDIPGYPRVDAQNPYLMTRYDGIVMNSQPWGLGGEGREIPSLWTASSIGDADNRPWMLGKEDGSDRFRKLLSKP